MPRMTHRTTFTLDEPTAQRLKRLAARWQVSQAEVVRRSVEQAEKTIAPDNPDPAVMLRELRLLRPKMEQLLGQGAVEAVRGIAERHLAQKGFLFLGRGVNFPVALEGALKLKERLCVYDSEMVPATIVYPL